MPRFISKNLLIIVMGAVCVVSAFILPYFPATQDTAKFFMPDNLQNVARRISAITVVSVGEVLVILTGGIDLSVGSIAALAQVVSGHAIKTWGWPVFPGMVLGVLTALACGVVNGLLVTKGRIPPFIVTLGMMLAARGAALGISKGFRYSGFPDSFKWLGGGPQWSIPFLVMMGTVAVFALILTYTRFGREVYATGGNLSGARLSGINVDRVRLGAYALCGTLAGFGGLMLASRSGVCDPTSAEGWELDAIAACVVGGASLIGGEGGAIGALLGALIIGVLVNICQLNGMKNEWQRGFIGVLIIVLVFVDNVRKRRAGKLKDG
ncbi:MAG: ABC transporter permease [Candidatus Hydrogenedentes bacterium]|nr:ABC transporter permease [Candidatus Hydrogenedentota bacterium]